MLGGRKGFAFYCLRLGLYLLAGLASVLPKWMLHEPRTVYAVGLYLCGGVVTVPGLFPLSGNRIYRKGLSYEYFTTRFFIVRTLFRIPRTLVRLNASPNPLGIHVMCPSPASEPRKVTLKWTNQVSLGFSMAWCTVVRIGMLILD